MARAARWRRLRFVMGITQMTGAAMSFTLIVLKGVSPPTLAAVVLTTAVTTVSLLLFGGRRAAR
jgi:hypothetical protein